MSKCVNKIIVVGYVGQDPVIKNIGGEENKQCAVFSLATSRRYRSRGEDKEVTDWHNVVIWDRPGTVSYIQKGTKLYIEGRIQYSQLPKTIGGETIQITRSQIVASGDVIILDGGKGRSDGRSGGYDKQEADDEYPF